VTVIMNKIKVETLFDTWAQASIISTHQLEEYFPGIQIQDVQDLFTEGKDHEPIMANGSKVPYKGWVKIDSQLSKADEDSIEVPILVTDYKLGQPIIG